MSDKGSDKVEAVPQTVKGYVLEERIGSGGFAEVYRAFQPEIARAVAIKVILPIHANNPAFIRRFEVEAHLIARLEHPFIVPLYDYWREASGAYLVMRWLQGGSLDALIRDSGPQPLERVAKILGQVTSALAAAHRRQVVHRDLKPGNILLDDEGNAFLADFGIAKDLVDPRGISDTNLIVGSPAYLSPEQINGQTVTPLSDLYSLAIVTYELLTGISPFRALTLSEMFVRHLQHPFPTLQSNRVFSYDTALVDHVLQRAAAKVPEQRFPDVTAFMEAFNHAAESIQGEREYARPDLPLSADGRVGQITLSDVDFQPTDRMITPSAPENPYKGLRAFQEADAADFFGRDTLIEQLLSRFKSDRKRRFMAIVGPSGSGKSSVLKAGLLPRVRAGTVSGSERWFVAQLVPGTNPFEELESALLRIAVNPPESLINQLREDERSLYRAVNRVLPDDDTELLLAIDQFEELFTLSASEEVRSQFLASLYQAIAHPHSRLRVIVTLRADFYDRPLVYQNIGDLFRDYTEVVLPLTDEELREAILGPARRVGLVIEPALLEAILHDVSQRAGALPLLQYALTELFERRYGNTLSLEAYYSSGGVFGALARRADELYDVLDDTSKEACRQLFLRLVTLGEGMEDTRRRAHRAELIPVEGSNPAMELVIESFTRYRLLSFDRDPVTRAPTIEIAHEAFIRSWNILRQWLAESREDVRIHRQLTLAARDWINAGREPSFLATGARLSGFAEWRRTSALVLSTEEHSFLEASIAERDRIHAAENARTKREENTARLARNFQRITILLLCIGIFAFAAAVLAFAQSNDARAQVAAAATAQQQLAGTSTQIVSALASAQLAGTAITGVNESLRLSAAANDILTKTDNEQLPAILLGIQSLRLAYTTRGDMVLQDSLYSPYTRSIYAGHTDAVTSAAFSPDGQLIVTGSVDLTARIWDSATRQVKATLTGHSATISSVSFSPDGQAVLTGSYDRTARLWDVNTGQPIRTFSGHQREISSVAFSPDGSRVITTSFDQTIKIWDTATGNLLQTLRGHNRDIFQVAFSQDGKLVISVGKDNTARLWDAQSGALLTTINEDAGTAASVALSPDNRTIYIGSSGQEVRAYAADSGQPTGWIIEHPGPVTSVAISADGKNILTGDSDRVVRLWVAATGRLVRAFVGHTDAITSALFSHDGRYILSASRDHTARLWEINPESASFSIHGATAASTWLAFAPGGTGAGGTSPVRTQALASNPDRTIWLWNLSSGKSIAQLVGHTGIVSSASYSLDGKLLLTSSFDKSAKVWNPADGTLIRSLAHNSGLTSSALSADGSVAATGSLDKTAIIWNVTTGEKLKVLSGHEGTVTSVAITRDGRMIATGSADKTVRLWDAGSGQEIRRFADLGGTVTSIAFSPDGKLLAVGLADHTARLWEVVLGNALYTFIGHADDVRVVAFAPDGTALATGSNDRTIRLWDVKTGALKRIYNDVAPLTALSVTADVDGQSIVAGSSDGTVRVWSVDLQQFLAYVCSFLYRDFTPDERSRFGLANTPTCPR